MTKNATFFLIFLAVIAIVGGVAWQSVKPAAAPADAPQSAATTTVERMVVKAYFGNEIQNPGALDCSLVYPVVRTIPKAEAVAQAALAELLKGPTPEEKGRGYFTSINAGTRLQSLVIANGVARADFDGRLGEQVGGSCLVTAIRSQIIETLKQFPTVTEVVISINGESQDILQP